MWRLQGQLRVGWNEVWVQPVAGVAVGVRGEAAGACPVQF